MSRILLSTLFALSLTACSDPKTAQPAKPPVEKPSYDQMLDTMNRVWDRADRICIEGIRENSFFVHFREDDYPDQTELTRGWYFVEKVEFYKASNNSWFITEIPDYKLIHVFVNTNSLQCKDKNATGT